MNVNAAALLSLAALTTLAAGGCSTSPRAEATAGQGQVVLVVRPAANVDAAEIVPAANSLSKLPDVLDVTVAAGRSYASATMPSDRSVVFVLTFKPNAGYVAAADWARHLADAGYGERVADVTVYTGTLQNYIVGTTFAQENTAATLERRAAAAQQQQNLQQRGR